MRSQRALLALLLVALVAALPLVLSSAVFAGTASDPDMTDAKGDSVSGRTARDLIAGWITNETETTLEFDLKMQTLEPYTPYQDWQNLPVVTYEFFFDVLTPVGLGSFAARATVPMHGPLASFATYEVYNVTYGSGGNVQNMTVLQTVNGRYVVNDALISFTVDKVFVGDPGRGDVVQGVWARIQSASQRNTGDAITEDVMMSHLSPGRSFTLTGGVTFYKVTLSANATSATGTPDDPAHFVVTIHSDSEAVANVSLRASSSVPANWSFTPDHAIYAVEPGQDVNAVVTITPGGNQTNVTRRITVAGTFVDDQNTNRSTDNTVTLSVYFPPGAGGGGGGGRTPGGAPGDQSLVFEVGAGVAVAAIAGALYAWYVYLPGRRAARARASYSKIAELKLSKSPRSGPLDGGPRGRPGIRGAPLPPRPIAPLPGSLAPQGRQGALPRAPPKRPVPRNR